MQSSGNVPIFSKETAVSVKGFYQSSLLLWALRQQIVVRRRYLPARPHNHPKILSPQYSSQCIPQTLSFIFFYISHFFHFLYCKFSLLLLFFLLFSLLTRGNCHFLAETFFDTIKSMKRPRHIELWNYVLLSCRNLPECQLLKVNATAWYYYIITIQSSCSTKAWNSCRSILPWPLQVN